MPTGRQRAGSRAAAREPSQRHLDARTLAKVERLELRARGIVEGFISGMHRSPYHGFSVEFSQYRGYAPGDDLRHLDWKLYARAERYYLKQYEEETNLSAYILLDASESMAYGSPVAAANADGERLGKLDYAKQVVAALAFLGLRQSDATAVAVVDRELREYVQPSTRQAHLTRICEALEGAEPAEATDLGAELHHLAERMRRRSIVAIVSDLFDDLEAVVGGIRRLRHAGHEVLVLQVLDEYELTFPFTGQVRFEGLEDEGDALCQPRQLRDEYLREFHGFLAQVRAACHQVHADYARLDTATPVDVALSAYLAGRERMRKGRR